MRIPKRLVPTCWLIRDTFRQSLSSGIFWIMLAISAVCILLCLSVRVEGDVALKRGTQETPEFVPRTFEGAAKAADAGVDVVSGRLTLAFGAFPVPLGRDREDAVRYLQLILAGGVADAFGLLLALIWTAGFLPAFLEASAVSVLLAKPLGRGQLLAGKYLGVLTFVGFQALIFVGGTWIALGLRTGVWNAGYLLCIPLLLIHFAIFFSFSTMLAVSTRSTVACVFGSLIFWLMCWGMNYARHALVALPETQQVSPVLRAVVEGGYWVLPKPADFGMLLFDTLHANDFFANVAAFQHVQAKHAFNPLLSVISSLSFTVFVLVVAIREFLYLDY